jgi:DNA-directed RNA polymerase specialized sigma24 family protein
MGSVSKAINELKEGNPEAQQKVLRRFAGLVGLARSLVAPSLRGRVSGSDILIMAMADAFAIAQERQLEGWTSEDFERLLKHIIRRTAREEGRRHRADRRDAGLEAPLTDVAEPIDPEPSPDEVVACRDLFELLTRGLDEERQVILRAWAEGLSAAEIRARLRTTFDREPPTAWMIRKCIRHACQKLRRLLADEAGTS